MLTVEIAPQVSSTDYHLSLCALRCWVIGCRLAQICAMKVVFVHLDLGIGERYVETRLSGGGLLRV